MEENAVGDAVGVLVFLGGIVLLSGGLLRGVVPSGGVSSLVFSHHARCDVRIRDHRLRDLQSLDSTTPTATTSRPLGAVQSQSGSVGLIFYLHRLEARRRTKLLLCHTNSSLSKEKKDVCSLKLR